MRQKERIDYIYFNYREAKRERIDVQRGDMEGISAVGVTLWKCLSYKKKKKENSTDKEKNNEKEKFITKKILKKMKWKLKNYQIKGCVLGAEEKTAQQLNIADLLFQARKMEMIRQKKFIFEKLRVEKEEGRGCMLLVLDSLKWNAQDVLSILLTAKDYYEDIYITVQDGFTGLDRIAECLYEEWGVVLHVCSGEAEMQPLEYDFILFLLKSWEKQLVKKYMFRKAYIVMDTEEGIIRKKEGKCKDTWGCLYSGLLYEKQHKQIPYQMAVNIAYQNPTLYKEFRVSFIAIYRV